MTDKRERRRAAAPLDHATRTLVETTALPSAERRAVVRLLAGVPGRAEEPDPFVSSVLARMTGWDFGWPEFDRWQAFFARQVRLPALWEGLRTVPAGGASLAVREAYRRRKLMLLLDWLRALDATRVALARYRQRGVRTAIARQGDRAACPVCDPFDRREVVAAGAPLPPFHPGCRCLLMASAPRPASAERSRRTVSRPA